MYSVGRDFLLDCLVAVVILCACSIIVLCIVAASLLLEML
jgi:hypothetical protein